MRQKFCLWNQQSRVLEPRIPLKELEYHKRLESEIQGPLTKTGIQTMKSGIHGVESKTVLDNLTLVIP